VQAVGAALRFGAALPARTRELAILTVATESGSEFEWLAHERQALADGVTPAELDALLDGDTDGIGGGTERRVVEVVRALARRRRLTDEEYADAVADLGEETLAELVWLCGYYLMLALALEVFSPPIPDELRQP
jgi:alkylhydroperoxidase family enzyme